MWLGTCHIITEKGHCSSYQLDCKCAWSLKRNCIHSFLTIYNNIVSSKGSQLVVFLLRMSHFWALIVVWEFEGRWFSQTFVFSGDLIVMSRLISKFLQVHLQDNQTMRKYFCLPWWPLNDLIFNMVSTYSYFACSIDGQNKIVMINCNFLNSCGCNLLILLLLIVRSLEYKMAIHRPKQENYSVLLYFYDFVSFFSIFILTYEIQILFIQYITSFH